MNTNHSDKQHAAVPRPPMPYAAGGPDSEDEAFAVASTQECTGLIPAAPQDGADAEAYREIYDIPLSSRQNGREPASGPRPESRKRPEPPHR